MKKERSSKGEAKWVAGVGSAVSVKLEGKVHEAAITRMGPSPNITVLVTDAKEAVEVAIKDVTIV